MDQTTRNKLRNAVAAMRVALEQDVKEQLEGVYAITPSGVFEPAGDVATLRDDPLRRQEREEVEAAIVHESEQIAGVRDTRKLMAEAVTRFARQVAFTWLNRLAAVKLMEARGLVRESVGDGMSSQGFKEFQLVAPEVARAYPDGGYRRYLELLFDDIAIEISVLFDRSLPYSRIFPSQRALSDVLEQLNQSDLADIWTEDETIGWIYQYFTPAEQRRQARKDSAAPRNSYELAFLNQFFTPRYVVQYLTDNTLGRTWYEMCRGETALTEQCEYLMRRKRPVFLYSGEEPPAPFQPLNWDSFLSDERDEMWTRPNSDLEDIDAIFQYALTVDGYGHATEQFHVECGELANERMNQYHEAKRWEGTFEELRCCLFFEQRRWRHYGESPEDDDLAAIQALHQAIAKRWSLETEYILHREKKDPRQIRVLDPACGSCHFLLYAFDLLETIYTEAYDDPDLAPRLQRDYPDRAAFLRAVPGLILSHNLHGIDIDLRACQIGELALYLRAKRANKDADVRHTNIVCAAPMPGDSGLLDDFLAQLGSPTLERMAHAVWQTMQGADEIGSLLKIEENVREIVHQERQREARDRVLRAQPHQTALMTEYERPRQPGLDYSDVTDTHFWMDVEERILAVLRDYTSGLNGTNRVSRRLFSQDSLQGFEFIDVMRLRYDVVLMNPPFGPGSANTHKYLREQQVLGGDDLGTAMVSAGAARLRHQGYLGAITSRTYLAIPSAREWRDAYLLGNYSVAALADLGYGVMDEAMVEAAAYVIVNSPVMLTAPYINALEHVDKDTALRDAIQTPEAATKTNLLNIHPLEMFLSVSGHVVCHWLPPEFLRTMVHQPTLSETFGGAKTGLNTGDDFRFLRLVWELSPAALLPNSSAWALCCKGGEYQPFYDDVDMLLKWSAVNTEMRDLPGARVFNTDLSFTLGVVYPMRTTSDVSPRPLQENCSFNKGAQYVPGNTLSDACSFICIAYTRPFKMFVEALFGGGDVSVSGSAARNYTGGVLNGIPAPDLDASAKDFLFRSYVAISNHMMILRSTSETSRLFSRPFLGNMSSTSLKGVIETSILEEFRNIAIIGELSRQIDDLVILSYNFGPGAESYIGSLWGNHPYNYPVDESILANNNMLNLVDDIIVKSLSGTWSSDIKITGSKRIVTKKSYFSDRLVEVLAHATGGHPETMIQLIMKNEMFIQRKHQDGVRNLLSYLVGCGFGRWDIRCATDPSLLPTLAGPFDALPVCPPGMLVDREAFPASRYEIASEEWLRARPSVIELPPLDAAIHPAISEGIYPLDIAWDGILVDDDGHGRDIVRCIREALALLFPDSLPEIEREACEILGLGDLRDWFRNPKNFWERHISSHSGSRRAAPIYWLLQSDKKSYAVWLYLHRITGDTLHRVMNDYVDPRIMFEERRLAEVATAQAAAEAANEGREARRLAKEHETQEKLIEELRRFRTEIQRVVDLGYDPDLDDGVVLNIAPLYKLVPWKEAERYWKELVAGKYEWSTMSKRLRAAGVLRA